MTPLIAETYQKIIDSGKKFGMVYLGFDKDEKSFFSFMAKMPWLSMPCGHPGVFACACCACCPGMCWNQ